MTNSLMDLENFLLYRSEKDIRDLHWTVLIQKEFRWIKTVGHREFSIEFSETEGRTGADEISNLHLFPFLPLFIFIHFCYNGEKCKDPEEVLDMKKKMMEREAFTIYDDNTIGTVRIADEVVAIMTGTGCHRNGRSSFYGRQYHE